MWMRDRMIDVAMALFLVAMAFLFGAGLARAQDPYDLETPLPPRYTQSVQHSPMQTASVPLSARVAAIESHMLVMVGDLSLIKGRAAERERELTRIQDSIDDLKWWLIFGGAGAAAGGSLLGRRAPTRRVRKTDIGTVDDRRQ